MSKKAVSPVIGVMLVLAVAVAAVGAYFNMQNMHCKLIELPENAVIKDNKIAIKISSEEDLRELEINKWPLLGGKYRTKYGETITYNTVTKVTTVHEGKYMVYRTQQGYKTTSKKVDLNGAVMSWDPVSHNGKKLYYYLKWTKFEGGYEGLALVKVTYTKETQYDFEEFNSIEEIKRCVECNKDFIYDEDKKVWRARIEKEIDVIYYLEEAINDNTIYVQKFKNTSYVEGVK